MNQAQDHIYNSIDEIKTGFLNAVDLFEEGKTPAMLEMLRAISEKLGTLSKAMAADYENVVFTRYLGGLNQIQQTAETLLKGDPQNFKKKKPLINLLLATESQIRSLQKEIHHNYPLRPSWKILFLRYRKPIFTTAGALFLIYIGFNVFHYIQNRKHGLMGTYFKDSKLTRPVKQRIDKVIDFDWKRGTPLSLLPNDRFSIRWEGFLVVPQSDTYVIQTKADDGVQLWLGSTQLIDDWKSHAVKTNSVELKLEAGNYPLKLEYFEDKGPAQVHLLWGKKGNRPIPIPREYLVPDEGTLDQTKTTFLDFKVELPAKETLAPQK